MGALATSEPDSGRRYNCKVASLLEEVDAEDREAIIRHLENPSKSSDGLARWLRGHDLRIGSDSIRNHRNGTCQCAAGARGVLSTGVGR
jgi:hypothetical protein